MVFPDDRTELRIGGAWVDVTDYVYARDPISITYGRADEGTSVDPGSCKLTLNNRAGRFSPRNPNSPYYGLIGRNTPLRVSVPRPDGEAYLHLDGSTVAAASTPDRSSLDITGDIDVRVEATLDWDVLDVRRMLIGKWNVTGDQRSWALWIYSGQIALGFSSDGTINTANQAVLNLPRNMPRRSAVRVTVDANNGSGALVISLYTAPSLDGPWSLSSTGTATGLTMSIFNSTAPLTLAPESRDLFPIAIPATGQVHRAEVRNGIGGTVVAAPDFRTQTAGATSFTDSAGLPWTAQAGAIDDRNYRFTGEVVSWPPEWDVSGNDVWTSIEAAGILRRLGQGRKPFDSTLRRRVPSAPGLLAYWPMEDGNGATAASSAVPGVPAAKTTGFSWAGDSTLGGSLPLPTLGDTATLSAPVPRAATSGWQVEMVYRLPTMPTAETEILRLTLSDSTIRTITVAASTAGIHVRSLDVDNAQLGSVTYTDPPALAGFVGAWNRLAVFTSPVTSASGGEITVTAAWRDVAGSTYWWAFNTPTASQMGRVASITGTWGAATQDMAIGHLSVVAVPGVGSRQGSTIYEGADDGFAGETAIDRMQRLANEESEITISTLDGDRTLESQAMGPQAPAVLLDLLQDCADADGGILYEDRDSTSLVYRDRSSLYNQTPAIVMDYAVDGEVPPPLTPVEDDQSLRNDVTVTRQGGGSGRVVIEDGPLSVLPPEDGGVGIYDESVTLNLATDEQTLPIAGWRAHLGTWDEARYPSIHLRPRTAPQLTEGLLQLRVGDKGIIRNPPPWLPPQDIEFLVYGYTETITPYAWDVTLNAVPARPWTVGELPSEIVETFESDVPVLPHTDGGDAPWSRVSGIFGGWSLASGHITDEQHTDAIFTMPAGAVQLTFQYLVSSEEGGVDWTGDQFQVYIDDVLVLTDQGSQPVKTATFPVQPGSVVVFRYVKDDSTAAGLDHAYINDLTVSTVDGGTVPRVDTGGSVLASAVDEDDTALPVTTTGIWRWITTADFPDEFPFDVQLGGEVVTVTAIAAGTTQTFTVNRGVNGIRKAHPAGEDVRLAAPTYVAL